MLSQASSLPTRSPLIDLFTSAQAGGEIVELARGMVLHRPGDPAEHMYYIQSGQVRLYQVGPDGRERLTEILGPGNWLGAAALSHGACHRAKAQVAASARLTKIPSTRVLEALSAAPQAAMELIRQFADLLQGARDDSARLVFNDCNQRLIDAMLRFSKTAAATQQGDNIILHLTHEQLAQAVGAARETISLALTEMRHRNIVRTGRNRVIFNREALNNLAEEYRGAPAQNAA